MTAPRLCACGCARPLGPRARTYFSRACTQRALWADPAQQAKRVTALRAAKARTRHQVWARRAGITHAIDRLAPRLEGLAHRDVLAIHAVIARVAREQYAAGYRAGRASVTAATRSRRRDLPVAPAA